MNSKSLQENICTGILIHLTSLKFSKQMPISSEGKKGQLRSIMIMLLLLAQLLFCKYNVNCNDNVLLRSLFLLQCNVYFQDLLEIDRWNILALVMIVLDWKKERFYLYLK